MEKFERPIPGATRCSLSWLRWRTWAGLGKARDVRNAVASENANAVYLIFLSFSAGICERFAYTLGLVKYLMPQVGCL